MRVAMYASVPTDEKGQDLENQLAQLRGPRSDSPRAPRASTGREEGGPFEIENCQRISRPGSYKLIKNLTFNGPSGSACLSITANFVTIDLAGFTITGTSPVGPGPFPMARRRCR
jgi:hypothetical protein